MEVSAYFYQKNFDLQKIIIETQNQPQTYSITFEHKKQNFFKHNHFHKISKLLLKPDDGKQRPKKSRSLFFSGVLVYETPQTFHFVSALIYFV